MEISSKKELKLSSGSETKNWPKELAKPEEVLAPNARGLWALLSNGEIEMTEKTQKQFVTYLKNLEKIEAANSQKKQVQEQQENFISQIEKSDYYQLAKGYMENLRFSAGYTVEIVFSDDRKLSKYKFEIRQTGKQRRHVTLIGLIERIIQQALQIGYTPSQILDSLWLKIQVFKANLDDETNKDIQSVFDYFKHPNHLNAKGINRLIKILANFYHDKLYLAFDDDYIKIPYKTNECYLVPTTDFGGSQFIHRGEGSFINALLKVLDGFEKRIENNRNLSSQQIHQMNYAIFAMFDFLSLPSGAKESKRIPDPQQATVYK